MSLLPARFQTSDDMPMSLGKAIALAIAPKVDRIAAFNTGSHSHMEYIPSRKSILLTPVHESDCRQIKGAAQAEPARAEMPRTPVAAPPSPPAAQADAAPPFKVGDRVRAIANEGIFFSIGDVGTVRVIDNDGCWVFWDASPTVDEQLAADGWKGKFAKFALIPTEPKADEAGWIEWSGVECPLPSERCRHEVRFRDGLETRDDTPGTWNWEHRGKDSDIVAYRVVKP